MLLERTSVAERERRLSDEVIRQIDDAGLLRVSAPRRLGGLCISVADTARIAASLARGCPSTAWIFCVANSNALTASLASEAIQRDVFADGVPIICGAASPAGSSIPAPGGRIATGRWSYISGCYHARWGAFSIADRSPDGTPLGATIYVPMSEVAIEDTWHVSGLKATGSNTVVASGVFVPEHRYAVPDPAADPGEAPRREAIDYVAVVPHFRALLLGVLVGAAEMVLERVIARAGSQGIVYTTYRKQADSQVVQYEIGEAAAAIQIARLVMDEAARAVDAAALRQQSPPYVERTLNRAQTCHAASMLVKAVERLIAVAGSWGFAESNVVQQLWRDLHVAASHAIMIPRVGYEIHGRALLGVGPTIAASDDLI